MEVSVRRGVDCRLGRFSGEIISLLFSGTCNLSLPELSGALQQVREHGNQRWNVTCYNKQIDKFLKKLSLPRQASVTLSLFINLRLITAN